MATVQVELDLIDNITKNINAVNANLTRQFAMMEQASKKTSKSFYDMLTPANMVTGAFAGLTVGGVVILTKSLANVAMEADRVSRTLEFATGSAKEGRDAFVFVSEQANRLGMNLTSSAEAFARLSAAAKGTSIEGAGARNIFVGISEASTVMGLSAENTRGALLAVEQMISKGSVSAEELRGQLGERLPGAFQIAARSMGVTTAQLGKMLEQGEVLSSDFLPKFANELKKTFGEDAARAAEAPRASFNRFWTEIERVAKGIGESITPQLADAANEIAEMIKYAEKTGSMEKFFNAISKTASAAASVVGGLAWTVERLIDAFEVLVEVSKPDPNNAAGYNAYYQALTGVDLSAKSAAESVKKLNEEAKNSPKQENKKTKTESVVTTKTEGKFDAFAAIDFADEVNRRTLEFTMRAEGEITQIKDDAREQRMEAYREDAERELKFEQQLQDAKMRLREAKAIDDPVEQLKIRQDRELALYSENSQARLLIEQAHEKELAALKDSMMQKDLEASNARRNAIVTGVGQNMAGLTNLFGLMAAQYKSFAGTYKAIAYAQAIWDAYAAAAAVQKAWAQNGSIPGAIIGGVQAAITLATGLARASAIKAQGFASGGMIYGPRHSGGGVPINAEGGEFVLSRRDVSNLGGPSGVEAMRRGASNSGQGQSVNISYAPQVQIQSPQKQLTPTEVATMVAQALEHGHRDLFRQIQKIDAIGSFY